MIPNYPSVSLIDAGWTGGLLSTQNLQEDGYSERGACVGIFVCGLADLKNVGSRDVT